MQHETNSNATNETINQTTNQPFHKQNSQQPTIQTTEQTGTAAVSEKDDNVVVIGHERNEGKC